MTARRLKVSPGTNGKTASWRCQKTKIQVLAPVVVQKKGEHKKVFEKIQKTAMCVCAWMARWREVTEEFNLEKNRNIILKSSWTVSWWAIRVVRVYSIRRSSPSFSGRLCDCRCDWWGRTSLQRTPFMSYLRLHGGRIRASSLLVQCAVWSVSRVWRFRVKTGSWPRFNRSG